MHSLSRAVEEIYCALVGEDEEVEEVVVVDEAEGDEGEYLLEGVDDWGCADGLILLAGDAFVDVDLGVENEDLLVEVEAVVEVDLLVL